MTTVMKICSMSKTPSRAYKRKFISGTEKHLQPNMKTSQLDADASIIFAFNKNSFKREEVFVLVTGRRGMMAQLIPVCLQVMEKSLPKLAR